PRTCPWTSCRRTAAEPPSWRPRRGRPLPPLPGQAGRARPGGSRRAPARGGSPPDPYRSRQVVQVLPQPRQEPGGHVPPFQRELDDRAKVVHRVAGIKTTVTELDAANPATLAGRHLGQRFERIGELDLVTPSRRGAFEHPEHGRVAYVT